MIGFAIIIPLTRGICILMAWFMIVGDLVDYTVCLGQLSCLA